MKKNIVIYGLGNMGFIIAKKLSDKFNVYVKDINHNNVNNAIKNFHCKELNINEINGMDFILFCLPNPKASKEILINESHLFNDNSIVIETSTVNPKDIKEYCEIIAKKNLNIKLIDASIMAGTEQMESGSAILLLGGDIKAIERAQGVFDSISYKQIYFGSSGSGAAAKVINNAVAHAVMVLVIEAGAMAVSNNIDCKKLISLLSDDKMGLHRPLTYRYADRIMNNNFEGGMPLSAAYKDSKLAIELCQNSEIPSFIIQNAHVAYEIGMCINNPNEDYSCLSKLWDKWNKPCVK